MKPVTEKEYKAMTPEQQAEHLKNVRKELIEDGLVKPTEETR